MRPRTRAGLGAAAAIGVALAAWAQDGPQSILPPGFGTAPPSPVPSRSAVPDRLSPDVRPSADQKRPTNAAVEPPADLPAAAAVPGADEAVAETDDALPASDATDLTLAQPEEMPDAAKRSLALVGGNPVYGQDAFGDGDGRYLATLMRRIQAPIASRWAEIALRRLLLGASPAPAGEGQADWVADRASLLLRLGEANAARMLVQSVDVENFSPRLRHVAIQSALASADPGGLCPLPSGSEQVGGIAAWPMIRAMCATLTGDEATANATIGRAPPGDSIDHALAEKLVAAGGGGRRSVPIDWTAIDTLTDWRFGLATALGVILPQPLLDAAPAWFQAWLAQAPMPATGDRLPAARVATAMGPLSGADLVDLYGRVADEGGGVETDSPAGRLRAAYRGDDDDTRLSAMHALWDAAANGPGGERDRYAASILTARAATGIVPDRDQRDDVAPLVASMLSGGFDRQAARWGAIADAASGADGDKAWAVLATGSERPTVGITLARLQAYAKRAGGSGRHRAAMAAAALAGLDRLSEADASGVAGQPLARASHYARALQRAVDQRASGTVLLLAAVGLQSPRWGGIDPADLYRMIGALRAVGLDGEARMIGAEAVTRL